MHIGLCRENRRYALAHKVMVVHRKDTDWLRRMQRELLTLLDVQKHAAGYPLKPARTEMAGGSTLQSPAQASWSRLAQRRFHPRARAYPIVQNVLMQPDRGQRQNRFHHQRMLVRVPLPARLAGS